MRAVVISEFGGPEVLTVREVADPTAGVGQLVVQVAAAGVNYMDTHARAGRPPYRASSAGFIPGGEGAGVVSEVGPDVEGFVIGDRVAWAGPTHSYAERVAVPAERAVPVPDGVDLATAAAMMLQGLTAHYLCASTFPVQPEDLAVVHAAAGGVGLLLTQLVKGRGGRVVATASSFEKRRLAEEAGADLASDYEGFVEVAKSLSGGIGAAVVYDGVGAATFDGDLECLRPRAMVVLYGASSGPVQAFDTGRLASSGSLFLTRPTLGDYVATRDELLGRCEELFELVIAGDLKVRVGGTYRFDEAAAAHEDLEGRRTTGKLLLVP